MTQFKLQIVELFSLPELAQRGYRKGQYNFYLGNCRAPIDTIPISFQHVFGRTVEVVEIERRCITARDFQGIELSIPMSLVKTKLRKVREKTIQLRNNKIKFNGVQFKFPCAMSESSINEARKVAKWVLKVSR